MPLPSPFEESRLEDIRLQMEYEYLGSSLGNEHEAGYIYVCKDNPAIEKAIECLSELRNFIGAVTDEESEDYEEKYMDFVDNFREEHGFKLSFASRSFWENFLGM